MIIDIDVRLHYRVTKPTDLLLQIEAAHLPDQSVQQTQITLNKPKYQVRVPAEEGIGERLWVGVNKDFICDYHSLVKIDRPHTDINSLQSVPPHLLPGELVKFLMPSRYCLPDDFQDFVEVEFGGIEGGAKISAMRDWIYENFQYTSGSSSTETTVVDSFALRQGVCRDYAHVLITLARAAAIPARFVSAYGPNVSPQDFHAVAEVYLDGGWHLVDATGMANASDLVRIGVGFDAASVAFMTTYGTALMVEQSVQVQTRVQA